MSKSKLFLPKHCIIPLRARLDKNIPDSAKIYLGEINVLANLFGYLTYSDQDLADMKEKSLRTIEKWHEKLEKNGHIRKEVIKKHIKTEKGVEVRTERKLFIVDTDLKNVSEPKKSAGHNQKYSKNVSDPKKSAGHCDPKKSAGHCDPKKSAGINNVTLPINFTKDNVPTMPSSKEIKNYKVYLTQEQRKLHDRLVKYQPEHGDQLKSDDVCAWFLKLKYSTQEVEKAFKVYQQRARKGPLNGRVAENMGGLMRWALDNKIEPENEDMSFNREFAEKMCKKYSFLEMTKNYVKVQFGNVSENVMINLPRNTFSSQLENFVNSAEFNCYV
jgi:hypothetical protein